MTVNLKKQFQKQKTKIINYREFGNFFVFVCRQQILYELFLLANLWKVFFKSFLGICKRILDKTAPMKQNYGRLHHSPFLNKEILKAITKLNKTEK